VAGNAALDDQAYITANIEQIHREKQQLISKLQQLGFVVYPSATNFIFVSSKPLGITSRDLLEFLKTKNVFLADFGLKQGLDDCYFRISVGTTRENQVLLEKLSDAIIE
jgi:histidinol-phosphate aminotransferase